MIQQTKRKDRVFLKDQGCLLRKTPSGEHYTLLVFFLREYGLQMTLCRKRSKASATVNEPDLFESGEVDIEKKGDSKPGFLKEFIPHNRYPGIARKYHVLEDACRLARYYEKNLVHMEFYDSAWELLHTALESFSEKRQSGVILLKSLFVFAKLEGYPVRDNWLRQLSPQTRKQIANLIQAPVDTLDVDTSQVSAWMKSLEQFLTHHTDILVPDQ